MALNIEDDDADRLARELAAETGESITTAVTVAIRERLERLRAAVPRTQGGQALTQIAARGAPPVRSATRGRLEDISATGRRGCPADAVRVVRDVARS